MKPNSEGSGVTSQLNRVTRLWRVRLRWSVESGRFRAATPDTLLAMKAVLLALLLLWHAPCTQQFIARGSRPCCPGWRRRPVRDAGQRRATNEDGQLSSSAEEAERLRAKAKEIRASLAESERERKTSYARIGVTPAVTPDFTLPPMTNTFRLYLDIGREAGTWMDPRWGASGRRLECTIDVSFGSADEADEAAAATAAASAELRTSSSSSSTPPCKIQMAPYARLRGGFDKMQLLDGGVCIEDPGKGSSTSTLRFCIEVQGASEGDVSIPKGFLFFALPCFGFRQVGSDSMLTLSTKEGTICVRQMGWHTGWRREESRILGVFRAVEIDKARLLDKF